MLLHHLILLLFSLRQIVEGSQEATLQVLVACPGLGRGKTRSEATCEETPVRVQFVILTNPCESSTSTAIDPTSPTGPGYAEPGQSSSTGPGSSYSPTGPGARPSCHADGETCQNDRDCCSMWCDYDKLSCTSPVRLLRRRRQLLRTTTPRFLPSITHDAAVYDPNSNYCAANSDCLSFRCDNGKCDDSLTSLSIGCDGTPLNILYTLALSLDANLDVGVPDFTTNPTYTQLAMPGEFVDMSFPGTIVLKYRTEDCDMYMYNCSLGALQTYTISVGVSGHQNDPDQISEDNKPAKGGNYSYIRSTVVFDTFKGGAGRFNRTGFVQAVVSAINYDRKMYESGVSESDAKEEFSAVPSKAVSIILIDPVEKMVQYEVRVKNEDAKAVRARLLHAYFKFPLTLRLSKYGILDHINQNPFAQITIDSENSLILEPEPIYYNTTSATLRQTLYELIGAGGVVGITLACITFIVCFVFVLYRFCRQEQRAKQQNKKQQALEIKENTLNQREKELAQELQNFESEKKNLLQSSSKMKSERDILQAEAEQAEKELNTLRQQQQDELLNFEASLLKEEEEEVAEVEKRLMVENEQLFAQIEAAKQAGNQDISVTIPPPPTTTTTTNDTDNTELENEVNALVISASMDKKAIQKQLDSRREKMMLRTRARNKKRKQRRMAAKEKEIFRQEIGNGTSTNQHEQVKSLWAKVGILDMQMKTNEQKVDELQRKAEESRKQLEQETKRRTDEAHNKLEARLRKRKAKKNKKLKQTKVAATAALAGAAPAGAAQNNKGRSLYD